MIKLWEIILIYMEKVIVATGLSQKLSNNPVFYYRLKNHKDFFNKIGINFEDILPRMSRDFLIKFNCMKMRIKQLRKFL